MDTQHTTATQPLLEAENSWLVSSRQRAFTLLELLCVIAIIVILMAFVLSVGCVPSGRGPGDRVRSEIAALEAAMESYLADNGVYPREADSDSLERQTSSPNTYPKLSANPSAYKNSSLVLYKALSGDSDTNGTRTGAELDNKVYFEFQTKKSMLEKNGPRVTAIVDPWGNSYGYSTAVAASIAAGTPVLTKGYNPTFDLWSTANQKPSEPANPAKWATNW